MLACTFVCVCVCVSIEQGEMTRFLFGQLENMKGMKSRYSFVCVGSVV